MRLGEFGSALAIYEEARPLLERYLPTQRAEAVADNLRARQIDATPVVMIYGVYNAGKSTLINALLGKEAAPIGDVPTTDRVDGYSWGGFELLDTPGIDAPIEHEAVTQAQLDRSDVVILVVSTAGVAAEGKTYSVAAKLVQSGRRVMLVLNNKSGLSADSEDLVAIVDRTRENLQLAAEELGLTDILVRVPVTVVNARSALRGRAENKPVLLRSSGMLDLDRRLGEFLAETSAADVARTMRRQVRELLEEALAAATAKADSAGLGNYEALQKFVASERDLIDAELRASTNRAARQLRTAVVNLLERQGGEPADGEALANRYVQEVQRQLEGALGRFSDRIKLRAGESMPTGQPDVALHVQAELRSIQEESDVPSGGDSIGDVLGNLDWGTLWNLLMKGGSITKMPIPKVPAPLVNTVLHLAQSLWAHYQTGKQMDAQRAQEQRRAQMIEDSAAQFAADWSESVLQGVSAAVDSVFGPLEAELERRLSQLNGELREVAVDTGALRRLISSEELLDAEPEPAITAETGEVDAVPA